MPNAWPASLTMADRSVTATVPSPAVGMKLPLFCKLLSTDFGLQALLDVIFVRRRLLSSSSFVRAISNGIHNAKLETLLVERNAAGAFVAERRHRVAGVGLPEDGDDLAVGKAGCICVKRSVSQEENSTSNRALFVGG
jgi:hypothetical protein